MTATMPPPACSLVGGGFTALLSLFLLVPQPQTRHGKDLRFDIDLTIGRASSTRIPPSARSAVICGPCKAGQGLPGQVEPIVPGGTGTMGLAIQVSVLLSLVTYGGMGR